MIPEQSASDSVAIVGLACRFPGARDPEEFWRNLRAGAEAIRDLGEEELRAAGVDPVLLARPDYVRRGGVLDDADCFDAAFFGLTPREAELIDPQQRVFLECAWAALEDAGWDPQALPSRTGVFAGAGLGTYLLRQIAPNAAAVASAGGFAVMIANDKDFLASRVAYKLDLRGPALSVQTACSTSLVAVHLAVQSLLAGECDTALAGGVSIRFPQAEGYLHREGMILSPDGRCRAFDAASAGTVGGNGAGVVVLKRLADALAAGDTVHAVIRGSAVNNDGAGKVGYTAPSVEGQEAVVAEALAVAGVDPGTIGYVEAHGTGTALGDPIEVAALTRAFRRGTDRRQFCALGSVKTNLGHLDAAAGIAGLIKAVLVLRRGEIPPSLHFAAPNPAIDFESSPFCVAASLRPWPAGSVPRRAGVSSFGIGGTNAHVILEEGPAPRVGAGDGRPLLLALSARTEAALGRAAERLAACLETTEAPLADIAYTLAIGRRAFSCRRSVVARTTLEAAALLRGQPLAVPGADTLEAAGRAWRAGGALDTAALFAGEKRRRVPLPTYSFERERHWLESASGRRPDLADWFYLPGWRRSPQPPVRLALREGTWLVCGGPLAPRLAALLRAAGAEVLETARGAEAAEALARGRARGLRPRWIVHTAAAEGEGDGAPDDLAALIQALVAAGLPDGARLTVAAAGLCCLPGEPGLRPEASLLLGPVRVLPREQPGLAARAVDVRLPADNASLARLLAEAVREGAESLVALRGEERWIASAEPVRLEAAAALRDRGVYLITGGLDGIGAVLAQDLAQRTRARLVLTGRTRLPERNGWAAWLAAHGSDDPASRRIRRIEAIEAAGGEVLAVAADAADEPAMAAAVAAARDRFGGIHGVIHAAGVAGGGILARRSAAAAAAVLAPKVAGARALARVLQGVPLDFLVLMSSLSAQLGEFGQADYAAANAFLDAFAQALRAAGVPAVAIAWDAWRDTGMAARLASAAGLGPWAAARRPLQIADAEGIEIFYRAIAAGVPHVIISTCDLAGRRADLPAPAALPAPEGRQARPPATPFVAPDGEIERGLAAIWEELIGVAPVGADDDFFDLGGHSLLATQVIARARDRWKTALTLPDIFEAPTLRQLARAIGAAAAGTEPVLGPVPRGGPLALSYQQQALWLLDRMEGGSAHLNELGAQTVLGPLDVFLLRRALNEVTRRHDSLRTRFVDRGGGPVQEIAPAASVDLPLADLSAREIAAQEEAVRRLAAELAARPFDLAEGPLLRAVLFRRGPRHHVIAVAVHHIVFDGWSAGIFFRELVAAYAALERGEEPRWTPLALQYADYAAWQRAFLAGPRREALDAFWREALRGPLPQLALPTDRPRPAAPAYRGEKHPVALEPSLVAGLEAAGRAQGASLFTVLLAAYGALLGRYAGQDEVVIGCPSAGRERLETEPLVGFFVNPLPLRLDLRGDPSFAALVERTHRTVMAATAHQALPFELMVEAARPPRSADRHPVFQTLFICQNPQPPLPAPPGLRIEPLDFAEGPARTDLDLYLWEGKAGARGYFIYDTALFSGPTVARLARRWQSLLEGAAADPARPVSSLRLDPSVSLPRISARPATA